jgi:two-component system chemotaxis sensor kinase CheA
LIFHPGFSTKSVTSEISGRGVGMDVVKTNVDGIGGQVDVTTKLGEGSVFRLQIPLSLAVIEGLVVTSENNRYVIPLSQVQQTINLNAQKVFDKVGSGSCFELRGTVVPLLSIDEVLGSSHHKIHANGTVLIVNVRDRAMGLVVHDIVRAQQIVIKPLSNGIAAQKGWIGSCVLGDGLPTLILNPVDLLSGRVTFGHHESSNVGGAA